MESFAMQLLTSSYAGIPVSHILTNVGVCESHRESVFNAWFGRTFERVMGAAEKMQRQ